MIGIVIVQGEVIHILVAMFQNRCFPLGKGGHAGAGAAAEHQLDGGVHVLHDLGGLVCKTTVFLGGLVADLPGAVHLVAQAPQLDAVGLVIAVLLSQVAEISRGIHIAVFQNVHGFLHTPGAQVNCHHHIGIRLLGPVGELVQAELVGLHHMPGQVQPLGPVFPGTDTVFPPVAGDKVAAGVADHGDTQLLHQLQGILAEALFIGQGTVGLVDAAVDGPAQVLDKGAVNAFVNFADLEMLVDVYGCLFHRMPPYRFRSNSVSTCQSSPSNSKRRQSRLHWPGSREGSASA